MSFLALAKNRYSERYFDPRPIEQEKLDRILEAGRVVPTACNYQPQRFYVIRSKEGLATLKQVTYFHYNAPTMIPVMMLGLGYPGARAKAHQAHFNREPIDSFVTEL